MRVYNKGKDTSLELNGNTSSVWLYAFLICIGISKCLYVSNFFILHGYILRYTFPSQLNIYSVSKKKLSNLDYLKGNDIRIMIVTKSQERINFYNLKGYRLYSM